MANNQAELHRIGRLGVDLAKQNGIAKGRKMPHNHPFDTVDTLHGTADEVKTMNENGKDIKIHIANKSFRRKLAYMRKHNLRGRLILIIIRPSALEKVE